MLLQTFSNAIIVVDYYTNTGNYAKNCENKYVPQMHCNGKCQLMQKLKKEEKKEQQNPERKLENKNEIPLSSKSFFATLSIPYGDADKILFPVYTAEKTIKFSRTFFHPPDINV
ncbi:MAG: hypothetical protein QM768_01055 [Agriterribacter sp.]